MSLAKKVFIQIEAVKVSRQLDSLAVQEICQMNNLKFFEKLEIYSLVLLIDCPKRQQDTTYNMQQKTRHMSRHY